MEYWRQTGILPTKKINELPITLVGVGGIGSNTAICLTKMGANDLFVVDYDRIENHNLSSTMFLRNQLGVLKTEAISHLILQFSDEANPTTAQKLDLARGLVISGVDSKNSRVDIWKKVKNNPEVPLYIDGRMTGQVGQVLTINPNDEKDVLYYDESLAHMKDDSDPTGNEPCTARAIIYNTFMIASLICEQVKRYLLNEPLHREKIFDFVTQTFQVSRTTVTTNGN